jgi:diadenylate cyclase
MAGPFPINFLRFGWIDAADVLLVTVLLYQLYKLLRGSVALNVALGLVLLYLLYLVVKATGMELLTKILGQFMSVGVLASIILFQQEIRRFLLTLGKATALERMRSWSWRRPTHETPLAVGPFVEAAKSLSNKLHRRPHLLQPGVRPDAPTPTPATGSMPKSASGFCLAFSIKPAPCTMAR